jgi:hypothetical protein
MHPYATDAVYLFLFRRIPDLPDMLLDDKNALSTTGF